MNAVIPLLAAFAGCVLAVLLDQAQFSLHMQAARTGVLDTWYLGALPITILFAAVLLGSAWAVAIRPRSPRWTGLLIAILAFVLLLALPFLATRLPPLEATLGRAILRSELLLRGAAPTSFLMIQICTLLLSGLWALVRRVPDEPPAP